MALSDIRGVFRGPCVWAPFEGEKKFVVIFNVKKYAKIWTLLKMYTWNTLPFQISKYVTEWHNIIQSTCRSVTRQVGFLIRPTGQQWQQMRVASVGWELDWRDIWAARVQAVQRAARNERRRRYKQPPCWRHIASVINRVMLSSLNRPRARPKSGGPRFGATLRGYRVSRGLWPCGFWDVIHTLFRLDPDVTQLRWSVACVARGSRVTIDYRVWVKPPPPWIFLAFFQNGWEVLVQILHAYYTFLSTLDYKFLFNCLQLWRSYATLSATTITCSKCSPSVETHAGWSHLIWHNFVTDRDNWIQIRNLAQIRTCNKRVKFGPKIPSCLGKMSENASVAFGRWWTFWTHGVNWVVALNMA